VPAFEMKVMARARCSHVCNAKVRIDCRKRIVGDFDICQSCCFEKGRLSAVGLTRKGQGDHVRFLIGLSGFSDGNRTLYGVFEGNYDSG
jgi:hypothetical protein